MNQIEICFSPALIDQYVKKDAVVVVTDVFRASTTICTALANQANSIIPVASELEAQEFKQKGFLTGAERKSMRCDFADFGNSPLEFSREKVEGKDIIFATSNGTKAIKAAADCYLLLIGAFINLKAVAKRCMRENKDVLIVCAGCKGRICVEDSLFAGALTACLLENDNFSAASDGTRIAVTLWHQANKDFNNYMMKSENAVRLLAQGFEEDLRYCLQQSIIDLVPELNSDRLIISEKELLGVAELESVMEE